MSIPVSQCIKDMQTTFVYPTGHIHLHILH